MTQAVQRTNQEEWLKVLRKGMITLPKKWRDEMGIKNGDMVKAKKKGNTVVIEAQSQTKPTVPYRIYSAEEVKEFLEEDQLPGDFARNVQERLAVYSARKK